MPASSRRKGVKGEREVARIWQAAGFDVRGLEGLGDHVVICGNGLTIHSEVKRAERLKLPEWLRQASAEAAQGAVPVVAFRQNRGEWYAALRLTDLVALARQDHARAAVTSAAHAKSLRDVIAFVRTGGPLNTKDREELIAFVSEDLRRLDA